jgi:hypothetical protein
MSLADDLAEIDCPECYRLAIEDIAEFASDPQSLAKFEAEKPKEAAEIQASLQRLLDMPKASLQELARALAVRAKNRVGIFQQ